MISPIHTSELIVAEQAARAGGDVLDRYFHQGVEVRIKDIANLVSDADLDAERTIVAVIRAAFPGRPTGSMGAASVRRRHRSGRGGTHPAICREAVQSTAAWARLAAVKIARLSCFSTWSHD